VCCWRKQLQQQQGQAQQQLKTRQDVHRPLQAVLHDLAHRGFQLEWWGAWHQRSNCCLTSICLASNSHT
jgi:hypothetical protein